MSIAQDDIFSSSKAVGHGSVGNIAFKAGFATYWALLPLLISCLLFSGCSTTQYLSKRTNRENALATTLNLMSRKGPQLQERTAHVLRRYGMDETYKKEPAKTLKTLRDTASSEADPERQFAVAELAYIEGKRSEKSRKIGEALEYYSIALISSYEYLFDSDFADTRSTYDPQFRGACDLYNEALEDTLRLLCADNQLRPGKNYTISTGSREFTIETAMRGGWKPDEFDHFEFVSDYKIETLNNRHKTYGLGVPLIAVRKPPEGDTSDEKYYPPGLSFAVTALLRSVRQPDAPRVGRAKVVQQVSGTELDNEDGTEIDDRPKPRCVLEFFDPLNQNQIYLANHWVPLQTDITTPLAYFLDTPQFRERNEATKNLIQTNRGQANKGLFMLEPYDPNRIPVVMVHGLWSSPLTWMDMFNDLRSFPEIRERYQFWFYLYPTGQPFWISATQMRADLADARQEFDPRHSDANMERMVLVGHSMGGLVSRMQTIDSGDDFWQIVSNKPIDQLKGDPDDIHRLASTLKFKPNESIKRVITIATPHHGSDFANKYTQWLGRALISLPKFVTVTGNRLIRENPDAFRDTELLTMTTSIDSLAPESPIFPVMLRAKSSPEVKYHNIVGVQSSTNLISSKMGPSDGVVSYESAKVEDAISEKVVDADHVKIHMQPETILEVRRILLQYLDEIDANDRVAAKPDFWRSAVQPASGPSELQAGNQISTVTIEKEAQPNLIGNQLRQ